MVINEPVAELQGARHPAARRRRRDFETRWAAWVARGQVTTGAAAGGSSSQPLSLRSSARSRLRFWRDNAQSRPVLRGGRCARNSTSPEDSCGTILLGSSDAEWRTLVKTGR